MTSTDPTTARANYAELLAAGYLAKWRERQPKPPVPEPRTIIHLLCPIDGCDWSADALVGDVIPFDQFHTHYSQEHR